MLVWCEENVRKMGRGGECGVFVMLREFIGYSELVRVFLFYYIGGRCFCFCCKKLIEMIFFIILKLEFLRYSLNLIWYI